VVNCRRLLDGTVHRQGKRRLADRISAVDVRRCGQEKPDDDHDVRRNVGDWRSLRNNVQQRLAIVVTMLNDRQRLLSRSARQHTIEKVCVQSLDCAERILQL